MWSRIAFRNVLRHRRRTALTAGAIVFSFALLLIVTGIADGSHQQMAEIGVRMGLGDVVAYARGYHEDPSLDRVLADPGPAIAAARALGPILEGVAPRLQTEGLAQAGSTGVGAAIWGVDPSVEGRLSKVGAPESIVAGRPLAAADAAPPEGQPPPIVIGRALAQNLNLAVGDRMTLTLRPARGAAGTAPPLRTGAFLVAGLYATGVRDVDAHVVLAPLPVIQALAGVGHGVTMVALLLHRNREAAAVAGRLRSTLAGAGIEVLPWQEAAPELYATIAIDEAGMYLMMAIIYAVVAAGILNTILLSVTQRTREFGLLLAVGATPGHVVRIVLGEAAMLGAGSVGLGLLLGLCGNHYFATRGLDLHTGGIEASGVLLPSHFVADLAPEKVVVSAVAVFALVLVSALYPVVRAARLEPVEAMHHV